MQILTEKEKQIIELLEDDLYTVEFCDEWNSRDPENVFSNAPAALQQMAVEGFIRAVRRIAAKAENDELYKDICFELRNFENSTDPETTDEEWRDVFYCLLCRVKNIAERVCGITSKER